MRDDYEQLLRQKDENIEKLLKIVKAIETMPKGNAFINPSNHEGGLPERFLYFGFCWAYIVQPNRHPIEEWANNLTVDEMKMLDRLRDVWLANDFAEFAALMYGKTQSGNASKRKPIGLVADIKKVWEKLSELPEHNRTRVIAERLNRPLSTIDKHVHKLKLRKKSEK